MRNIRNKILILKRKHFIKVVHASWNIPKLHFMKCSERKFSQCILALKKSRRKREYLLVGNAVFSETAQRIFLIFCMKLGDYKGRKVTEPDFWKKFLIWRYSRKSLQISPKSDVFWKTALTTFIVFGLKLVLNMTFAERKLKSVFGRQNLGTQTGIPVSQTVWISHCICMSKVDKCAKDVFKVNNKETRGTPLMFWCYCCKKQTSWAD